MKSLITGIVPIKDTKSLQKYITWRKERIRQIADMYLNQFLDEVFTGSFFDKMDKLKLQYAEMALIEAHIDRKKELK